MPRPACVPATYLVDPEDKVLATFEGVTMDRATRKSWRLRLKEMFEGAGAMSVLLPDQS